MYKILYFRNKSTYEFIRCFRYRTAVIPILCWILPTRDCSEMDTRHQFPVLQDHRLQSPVRHDQEDSLLSPVRHDPEDHLLLPVRHDPEDRLQPLVLLDDCLQSRPRISNSFLIPVPIPTLTQLKKGGITKTRKEEKCLIEV